MSYGKEGIPPRFGPSDRTLDLAQHKTSRTVTATTPCEKLSWGNRQPIWPVSDSALGAVPSARIQYLARPKRDFSARENHRRKEEASFFRKTRHPSSGASHYEHIVRLSTPKTRRSSSQEAGPPHSSQCENNCPIWHVDPKARNSGITFRLLQLANPKMTHPDYRGDRETAESVVSSKTSQISPRLVQLSLPRIRRSNICWELGRPEESIWTVRRAARRTTASAHVDMLAKPKELLNDYIPPREAEWSQRNTQRPPSTLQPIRQSELS